MHRLLVTSAAYRRSSRSISPDWSAEEAEVARERWQRGHSADPQNRFCWRMNRRRLEGETVRDSMLSAAGSLSQNRGGPGIMAPLPGELVATLLPGQWKASDDAEAIHRRSVYLFVRRNLRYPLFDVLDRPDTNASCPRRNVSTTAPQALALLNSEFSFAAARELAGYITRHSASNPAAQIDLLYQRTLARPPIDSELAAATEFLGISSTQVPPSVSETPATLIELCLAMFNLNEFIYVD
jgi:hypothetical protein